MWTIRITILILLALVVNHLVYGFGCWGLQPGGPFSAKLYFFQIVIAFTAAILACYTLLKSKPPNWSILLSIIGITLAGAIGTFCFSGYWIFTSAHFQGIENLHPFLSATATATATAIIAGYIRLHTTRQA